MIVNHDDVEPGSFDIKIRGDVTTVGDWIFDTSFIAENFDIIFEARDSGTCVYDRYGGPIARLVLAHAGDFAIEGDGVYFVPLNGDYRDLRAANWRARCE